MWQYNYSVGADVWGRTLFTQKVSVNTGQRHRLPD